MAVRISRYCIAWRLSRRFNTRLPQVVGKDVFNRRMYSSPVQPRSQPRTFPCDGYYVIKQDQPVEEERISRYEPGFFYPVRLGEVFIDRFQTITKLGYGASSTIWLARDLHEHQYVALKVYIHNSLVHRELPFYEHLKKHQTSQHPGADNIRQLLDSFNIDGPDGKHIVLVHQVAQTSLYDINQNLMDSKGFHEDLVKEVIRELLKAVDFLHTEVQAVHTDIHPGNLLAGLDDNSRMKSLEDGEFSDPVPRKELSDRTIYISRLLKPVEGPLLLSDFGEAQLGAGPHHGRIMPMRYRAPEVMLQAEWSYPVDIWSVGLTALYLLEEGPLFGARDSHGDASDGVHFSELIAALGPAPMELLAQHREIAHKYWDEDGNWIDSVPIPIEKTLEASETKLTDNTQFLRFIRRALTWDPRDRPTAQELLQDLWLIP